MAICIDQNGVFVSIVLLRKKYDTSVAIAKTIGRIQTADSSPYGSFLLTVLLL
jgi:hypothetical protein